MPFFRDNSRTFIVSGGVIFGLIVFYYLGALSPLERVMNIVVEPLQAVVYSGTNSLAPLFTEQVDSVLSENTVLKEQVATLTKNNAELALQIDQYKEYEEQLRFAQVNEYAITPAKIISRVRQGNTSQIITINLGEHNGVQPGYPVIYGDGILVGLVQIVHDSYAEVALITGQLISIQGIIQNESKTPGLVKGEFGTGLLMDFILKENTVKVGDAVVTSGEDAHIPRGLLIGTVDSVRDESSELFKQASIRPVLPYEHSSIVSVIMPN